MISDSWDISEMDASIRQAEQDCSSMEMFMSNGYDRSAWERGLDCIDSILEPGTATLASLTDEQLLGLKDLKAMMLSGAVDDTAKNHIPQALLESSDDNSSSNYLLAEYAGFNRRPSAFTSMNKVFSAQKVALKFKKIAMRSLRAQSTNGSDNLLTNMPEYWFELDDIAKLKLRDLLSWESISRWDFDVFDVNELLKGKNTLVFISWAIIAAPHSQYIMDMACAQLTGNGAQVAGIKEREGYHFVNSLKIRERKLIDFLCAIEGKYHAEVSYHNHVHAADVTQSLHVLLQMGAKEFTEEKLELFSLLIASVVHDVGHAGLNNSFHINSRSELAILYNDVSVLENMHVSTMFKLLLGDSRERRLDIFENFDDEQTTQARDLITKAVLSTDMTKHFAKVNAIKGMILGADDNLKTIKGNLRKDISLRNEVLTFIIHLADISNPSKETPTAVIWTDKLLDEWFRQGDLEESMGLPFSPSCDRRSTDREKSQIGFINFIVMPSYELLGRMLPRVEAEIVPRLKENLKYWKEQEKIKT